MASRSPTPADSHETTTNPAWTAEPATPTVSADGLLDLLGDDYTRRVLESLLEQPRTGSDVVEATGVSKATAYRRLNSLEEAGLVETSTRIDADGHHCKRFHVVVDSLAVDFADTGYDANVEVRAEHQSDHTVRSRPNVDAAADD